MSSKYCPVCGSTMTSGLLRWHRKCTECGYEHAEFAPAINEQYAHELIHEEWREDGLRSLRTHNFKDLLNAIAANGRTAGRLLDVGCAHGWFLEAAAGEGFETLGIEPDVKIYDLTASRNLPVRQGFFPDVLKEDERFDIIVFNDVFEHIPDVEATLSACANHLAENGLLVINLPSSAGFLYKVSGVLCSAGYPSFFERFWQKGLPSPHLHYFSPRNLRRLLEKHGFYTVKSGRLATIRLKGLFTRISYIGDFSLATRIIIWLGIVIGSPFIRSMPSDIIYSISRKSRPTSEGY